jgi:hypothetical protein
MAHKQILPGQVVSTDVNTALTFFALDLLDAFDGIQADPLVEMGMQATTSALNYKMPLSVGDPLFQKISGDFRYRRLGELMLSVATELWQDGVLAEARVIESDQWTGWGKQPAKMALAAIKIASRAIAAAIQAGKTTPSLENLEGSTTIKFFDANHPVDPFDAGKGSFSNLFTTSALTAAVVDVVWQAINTMKSPNGVDYRNLTWTHVLVGKDLEQAARRLFENPDPILVSSGTSTQQVLRPNIIAKYGIKVMASPYLTDAGVWYPICTEEDGEAPWITLRKLSANPTAAGVGPATNNEFEMIVDDKSSELYKHGSKAGPRGHVGIAAKREVGAALTTPFRLFRCEP